jgi:uncharacterized membrane protein
MQFLKYFVLEFAIIFVVGTLSYWLMGVPYNTAQLIFSAVVAGGIIAGTMVWMQNRRQQ